jgi:hypothetical protein
MAAGFEHGEEQLRLLAGVAGAREQHALRPAQGPAVGLERHRVAAEGEDLLRVVSEPPRLRAEVPRRATRRVQLCLGELSQPRRQLRRRLAALRPLRRARVPVTFRGRGDRRLGRLLRQRRKAAWGGGPGEGHRPGQEHHGRAGVQAK